MGEPSWLAALRSDPGLIERLGLRFFEDDKVGPIRDLARQAWAGKLDEEIDAAGHARIDRSAPVGVALTRHRRVSGDEQSVVLWVDPEGDQLFAGFTLMFPPPIWLPLGTTAASILAALAPYGVAEPAPVARLPRVERWLKEVEPEHRKTIEGVIARFEPWIDDASWANGHADDPWTGYRVAADALGKAAQLREAAREQQHRIPSTSYRTLWSRSALTIEYHPFHCVFMGRYAPAAISAPRAALDAVAGATVASEVPLDLVGSLLRAGNITVAELERLSAEWQPALTIARCALEPGEPSAGAELRARLDQLGDDPETRELFVKLARHYHHHWVLVDFALAHPEAARSTELAPHLASVLPPSAEVSR
jgi:hypothetical protein